jgi:hypothetical protein
MLLLCGSGRCGLATHRENDFARALIIDEQVQLGAELARREDFQLANDFAGAGRQLGHVNRGALRTEATVVPSAFGQPEDRHGPAGLVVQADDHLALLTSHTVRNVDVGGLGLEDWSGRRSQSGVSSPRQKADANHETETRQPPLAT